MSKISNNQAIDFAQRLILRQQFEITVGALEKVKAKLADKQHAFTSYNIATQALAQIRELEK